MAYLVDKKTKEFLFLYAHHSFGRFQYSVDTLIADPSVSKIHATVEWINNRWFVRDLSTNGTWLNHKKLNKDEPTELRVGDVISFSGKISNAYVVKELSAPCDKLVKLDANNNLTSEHINLTDYNLIPEKDPDYIVFYDKRSGKWFFENVLWDDSEKVQIKDDDRVLMDGENWIFKSSHIDDKTQVLSINQMYIKDLKFFFHLSMDEENTELKVEKSNKIIDLHSRAHHYLTVNLARRRIEDEKKGIPSSDQGWVNTEQLVKDLGVDMHYLNIQIHRARKQFSEYMEYIYDAENIIERQLRKVRFSGSSFAIYKGCQLESSMNVNRQ